MNSYFVSLKMNGTYCILWSFLLYAVCSIGITNGCPADCYCSGETCKNVFCQSQGLKNVPTGIPNDTCYLYLYDNLISRIDNNDFHGLSQLQRLMASRPRKRKAANNTGTPLNGNDTTTQDLVERCVAAILPTIRETIRDVISGPSISQPQPQSSQENQEFNSSSLQMITGTSNDTDFPLPDSVSNYGQQQLSSPSSSTTSLTTTADWLINSSLSSDSLASYRKVFAAYKSFITNFVLGNKQPLPPVLSHLILYIAHCYKQGFAASTTKTHISALSYTFQLAGYPDLTQHFLVKKQLQGFSKVRPTVDCRLPITPPVLQKIIEALPHTTDSRFTKTLLQAMFLLAFYAFLRVGEITKTSGANQHYLLRKHLKLVCTPQTEDYLELTIPHYKHSKNVITLHIKQNTATPALCPLKACQAYLLIRSHLSIDEPLFSFMDGTPISRNFFTENLQHSLAFSGLDIHQYHSHSFRIGAATTAASSGSSEVQIQQMGRWKSSAYKKYIRIPTLQL